MKKMTYGQFKNELAALADKLRTLSRTAAAGAEEADAGMLRNNAEIYIEGLEKALKDDFGEFLDD